MSHAVADDLLKQPPNGCGSYLVHDESEDVRCLTLRVQDCIKHYKVESSDGSVYLTSLKFKTFKDLISHYMTSPLESTRFPLLEEPCSNPFGPLQPHVLHDVNVKHTISESPLTVLKEFQIEGRGKCAGKQFTASLFSLNTAEEVHEVLLRFSDQCRLLKNIQHPNIVEFLGVYFEKGSQVPYVVTEFYGSNLSTYLEKYGMPTPPVYNDILSDVAAGLHYLHEQSPPIIHGNLSSRSVLLCSNNRAKISDLGTIQILNHIPVQMKTDPEMLCYMAPEAYVGEPKYNTAMDCFSFGILMIHTLCAKCPIPDCPQPFDVTDPESKQPLNQYDMYISTIYCKHPLLNLIHTCLEENPRNRCDMLTILKAISQIKVAEFPVFVGKCDHDSSKSDELSFKKGDLLYIIGMEKDGQWFAQLKETRKQGYISHTDAERWHNLDAEVWFFGNIKKMDAEKHLLQPYNQSGSFLVRKSESIPDSFTITLRKGRIVTHYRIECNKDEGFFIEEKVYFPSIMELVNYYSKHAGERICTLLMYPCRVVEKTKMIDLSKQAKGEWEINRCEINLVDKLSKGPSKEVWEGMWNEVTPVAVHVKTSKSIGTTSSSELLQEADVMKKLHHANVIQLYGVCTKEEPTYIITELMINGNLLDYLRGDGCLLTPSHRVDMCAQVSCGMAYLAEQNIVHKDLAAQNILVAGDITCKVANFSKVHVIKDDSRIQRIQWMAPEAALHNQFSTKSDVWSFGIVMYEVLTKGGFPYHTLTDAEVLEKVQQGYRIRQPTGCPDHLYNIMMYCWKADPEQRYTFEALESLLTE